MQNFEMYKPLIELSSAINECRKELKGDLSRKRKSDFRKIARSLEHKLDDQCEALIYRTLNTWDVDESLSKYLSDELNALKSGTEESWHADIDIVKVRLARLAENQSRKSSVYRTLERYRWLILIVLVIVTVLAIRLYSQVDVSYPPETTTGVVQGGAALEKLARYDDTLGNGMNDVGLFKRIVFWPVKPTQGEVEYALGFVSTTTEVFDALQKENLLCNTDAVHDVNNGNDERAIALIVVDYVERNDQFNSSESGTLLIEKAFKRRFYCS